MIRPTTPIHIVDDDPAACEALTSLVQRAGLPTVSHSSAEEFSLAYDPDRTAALVLDVLLPGVSGLDLLGELEDTAMMLPTLVLSAEPDIERVVLAIQRGAVGFLPKPPDPGRLLELLGQMVAKAEPMAAHRRQAKSVQDALHTLTPREREVFDLLLLGRSAKQIAHDLELSPRTAHIHRMNVLRKLRVETVFELHRVAGRLRLLPTD